MIFDKFSSEELGHLRQSLSEYVWAIQAVEFDFALIEGALEKSGGVATPNLIPYIENHLKQMLIHFQLTDDIAFPHFAPQAEIIYGKVEFNKIRGDLGKLDGVIRLTAQALRQQLQEGQDIGEVFNAYKTSVFERLAVDVPFVVGFAENQDPSDRIFLDFRNKIQRGVPLQDGAGIVAWQIHAMGPEDEKMIRSKLPWPILKMVDMTTLKSLKNLAEAVRRGE